MKNVVITIARHFGSGGKTIGKMLSEDLGISYYEHEIIEMASEESGIAEELSFRRVQREADCTGQR